VPLEISGSVTVVPFKEHRKMSKEATRLSPFPYSPLMKAAECATDGACLKAWSVAGVLTRGDNACVRTDNPLDNSSLTTKTYNIYIAVSKYERMNPNAATRLELTQPQLPTRQPKVSASLLPFLSGCKVIHALAVRRNHLQLPSNSTVFLTSCRLMSRHSQSSVIPNGLKSRKQSLG